MIIFPMVDLSKVNWEPSGKDSPFQIPIRTFMIHGKRSKHQHKWNLEEVDSNPYEWLWWGQDFSGWRNCKYGGNSKRTRIRSRAWRCDELLQSHDKTFIGEELLLKDEHRGPEYTSFQRRHTHGQQTHKKIRTPLIIREIQNKSQRDIISPLSERLPSKRQGTPSAGEDAF